MTQEYQMNRLPSIVHDADVLVEYLSADPLELTATAQHFKFRDLQQLNELLTQQTKLVAPGPRTPQNRYGSINFLYHLLLAGRLTYIGFKGRRVYLQPTERLAAFRKLSPMGRYLSLLEICWVHLDWQAATQYWQVKMEDVLNFQATLRYFAAKKADAVVTLGKEGEVDFIYWAECLSFLSFMGLWDVSDQPPPTGTDAFHIKSITITEFGAKILPILADERPLLDWNRPLRRYPSAKTSLKDYPALYRGLQDMIDKIGQVDRFIEEPKAELLPRRAKTEPDTGAGFRSTAADEAFLDAFAALFPSNALPECLPPIESAASEGLFTFKVELLSWDKPVWRRIELGHSHTLHDLHSAILESVKFDDDHLYSFFMDNEPYSNNCYASDREPDKPSASKADLGGLGLEPGNRMLYIFDYGDDWNFSVLLESIDAKASPPAKPRVVESFGKAPKQYG